MEEKTIGKFLAALRKASGMTQKDLAEKLNVSDKSVSRWERDEGAPDLSLIPVIAEIYGVTCDEILRGERKAQGTEASEAPTPKGEKQRKRLLNMALSRYRAHSFISAGISALGLIAAMIGNLGFNRGYIGFLAGAAFFVASLVCQAIFANGAFQSISDESFTGPETEPVKTSLIAMTERAATFTLILFGTTLPLLVFPGDAYLGLEFVSWLLLGAVFGVLTGLACRVIRYYVRAALLKRGICTLGEEEEKVFWHNYRLKGKCIRVTAIFLAITLASQAAVNELAGPRVLAEGTLFYDYDSFVAFMEQDIPYLYEDGSAVRVEPLDGIYYDEDGNEITEEEALTEELRIPDGSEEGKLVCTYICRNNSVISWSFGDSETGLPIRVMTQEDYRKANELMNLFNIGFIGLYSLEILGAVLIYGRKRRKL